MHSIISQISTKSYCRRSSESGVFLAQLQKEGDCSHMRYFRSYQQRLPDEITTRHFSSKPNHQMVIVWQLSFFIYPSVGSDKTTPNSTSSFAPQPLWPRTFANPLVFQDDVWLERFMARTDVQSQQTMFRSELSSFLSSFHHGDQRLRSTWTSVSFLYTLQMEEFDSEPGCDPQPLDLLYEIPILPPTLVPFHI